MLSVECWVEQTGAGANYYYTGPGYDYQRVLDRHQDLRYDERFLPRSLNREPLERKRAMAHQIRVIG